MDYQVVWSPEALEDVESIAEYIARDSRIYASSVTARILDVAITLSRIPLSGRIVPELEMPYVRELFVYSYRIIYRIQERRNGKKS